MCKTSPVCYDGKGNFRLNDVKHKAERLQKSFSVCLHLAQCLWYSPQVKMDQSHSSSSHPCHLAFFPKFGLGEKCQITEDDMSLNQRRSHNGSQQSGDASLIFLKKRSFLTIGPKQTPSTSWREAARWSLRPGSFGTSGFINSSLDLNRAVLVI